RSELHPYLAVVLRDNDCPSLRVGGAADHIHLFFGLSRTLPVAKVVEIVKTSSSKWIKTKGPEFARFHWQGGEGVFSCSQTDANAVVRYIDNQEAHHRRVLFLDEFPTIFQRDHVSDYERYVLG